MPAITPAIGDEDFVDLKGIPDAFGDTAAQIAPEMADGNAFRLQGKKAAPYVLESWLDQETAGDVAASIADYKALCGTLVTVTDAIGNSWPSQLVHAVQVVSQQKVAGIVGGLNVGDGDAGFWLVCKWTMQAGQNPDTSEPEPPPEP